MCIPQSLLRCVISCKVEFAIGDRLQSIAACGRRDHRPVHVTFQYVLAYQPNDSSFHGDRTKFVSGGYEQQTELIFWRQLRTNVVMMCTGMMLSRALLTQYGKGSTKSSLTAVSFFMVQKKNEHDSQKRSRVCMSNWCAREQHCVIRS